MKTFEPIRKRRTVTAAFAAQKLQVTPRTIRNYQAEERSTYEATAAARRRIAGTMHAKGASWAEIAEAVGGTEWAARGLVRRYKAECIASGRDPNTGDLLTEITPLASA